MRSLERVITGVVRFKAVQWAEWEEKHESDGYIASSENLEPSLSSSTTVMHIPIVRPPDLKITLVFHQIFPTPSLHPPVTQINVYGLVVMGQGEGGILALSWGWCSLN